MLAGRRPIIRSDGTPERDFLYVEDAVAAYLAIADALDGEAARRGEAFNAGGGSPVSISELVSTVCRLAGTDLTPDIRGTGTPAGEIDRQYVDITKIGRVCGWTPTTDLDTGLAPDHRLVPPAPRGFRWLRRLRAISWIATAPQLRTSGCRFVRSTGR